MNLPARVHINPCQELETVESTQSSCFKEFRAPSGPLRIPCAGPLKSHQHGLPGSFPRLPAACPLLGVSHSPIKTHSHDIQQRFSPIHF
jgi:hypothetical protein